MTAETPSNGAPLPKAEDLAGFGKVSSLELAKIYENIGHDSTDNPEIAMGLLDAATALRVQANQEMLAEEKETENFAAQTADKLGMSPEQKAKFLADVSSVLKNSRASI